MKQIIYGMLAASMMLGAASTASAWGYTRCKIASGVAAITVTNQTLANNCKQYLVGEGVISRGDHQNNLWKYAYPNITFKSAVDEKDDVKMHVMGTGDVKLKFEVKGKEPMRTKQISHKDIDGYMNRLGTDLNTDQGNHYSRVVDGNFVNQPGSITSYYLTNR